MEANRLERRDKDHDRRLQRSEAARKAAMEKRLEILVQARLREVAIEQQEREDEQALPFDDSEHHQTIGEKRKGGPSSEVEEPPRKKQKHRMPRVRVSYLCVRTYVCTLPHTLTATHACFFIFPPKYGHGGRGGLE